MSNHSAEDEAAKEAHKKMSLKELKDAHETAKHGIEKGNEYFQREEERIRKEIAHRAGNKDA